MAFLPFLNNFEEGTNGTTITTGNSGGTGQTAFNAVGIGTGATVAYSNTQAAHGSLSAKCQVGSTSGQAYVSWTTGSQSTIYGRMYVYLTGNVPSGGSRLVEFWNGGDQVTYCGGIAISSSNWLAIQVSAAAGFTWVVDFSNTIPLNTWTRIEWKYTFSATNGSATVSMYNGDSTTPIETHTTTGQNFGASTVDTVDLGWANFTANQPALYIDDLEINSVGFPGPAVNSVQRSLASNLVANTVNVEASSFTITWPINPAAGSKILVGISMGPGVASQFTSVVDNGATPTTFTMDAVQSGPSECCATIWRGDNITLPASGGYTITITLASSQQCSAGAVAYTNVASGPPTATNNNTGTSSHPVSGFASSSGVGALYVSVYSSNSGNNETITATASGFVQEFVQTNGSGQIPFSYADKVDYAGPTSTQSTWTLSDAPTWETVIAVYDIVSTTVTGTSSPALQPFTFTSAGHVSGPSGTVAASFQPFTFTGSATNTGGTIFMNNVVTGAVLNDYGLDNVPYTIGTVGTNTMLFAYVGWDVAQQSYQSSGLAPAVNVTDSADNLWRQIGISTLSTSSRAAVWVADNPRQVNWVSVAVTGWAYSTSYVIAELNGVPSSLGQVSLDFVKTVNGTAGTSLSLPFTASTNDIGIGIVSTGGAGGGLTVPVNWLGVGAAGGATSAAASTYAMWTPNITTSFNPAFNPSWANSEPYSGIVIGLKKTAAVPVQSNSNFPALVVEAAFGATPGDPTQSVDYTWDVNGLTWTDITSRVFSKGDSCIRVKRGRQYELSQEETGELEILLDNHDGAFTYGNTSSPYYPNVIPGIPIRVTAWWDGVQYPVAFGYVERWPQTWPDMPQWGFSSVVAVDAYGPMSSVTLPSAVEGDIRVTAPYAYFPNDEQYSFTTQALTPIATPINANGLIAINKAFGNDRYGAYRDGFDQSATVGQALNLLGDQDTVLGATTYQAQESGPGGPGMFYFDPNIPTNNSGNGFSVEFWFVWGNNITFSNTYFTAWGKPSSFWSPGATSNGGVLTVGVNTGTNVTAATGLWVNGVEITGGTFNQTTLAPQHFALTTGPNGTACYLNGVQCGTQPTLGTIPSVRAFSLGPARFTYDVNDNVVYDGYNYIAGHAAWYGQELTGQQIANHYTAGVSGWVGVPAPGRFAQILTWGRLGLKRGGTAWFQNYGDTEDTYMAEAYGLEGSSAASIIAQLTQTEQGRCFTQANGSVVYLYRWSLYDGVTQATFGDNGTTEIPFAQNTSFSVDNQFIYNQVTVTQTRGPNQDATVIKNNFPSQYEYFNRSGLNIQSYSMLPFDVFDAANWAMTKYNQPHQRVESIMIDVAKIHSSTAFSTILGLGLNNQVVVNRRPVGGATLSVTGSIQEISHEIGAAFWQTTYQVAPNFPESNTLIADSPGNDTPGSNYLSW